MWIISQVFLIFRLREYFFKVVKIKPITEKKQKKQQIKYTVQFITFFLKFPMYCQTKKYQHTVEVQINDPYLKNFLLAEY